ncbi:hypothetical protein CDD82_5404 [Ophiocordyceps australis]|uniref:Oxidoreductase n=1 Tax=Ophiocordyceps australis TaxID=1399860 RepID=A0A2C5Z2B5_9HYPO|nr:hypothetical protein CDD82_5404 [Ophiocordyceps australis]
MSETPKTAVPTAAEMTAKYADLIKGKTILTTGVSPTSIGAEFVKAVAAASPALLILAGRDADKLKQTQEHIVEQHPKTAIRLLLLNLDSQAAIRKAADEVKSWASVPCIHVVVNSAGIMAQPYGQTEDGIERHLGSNHIGHFLFVNLIMDKILAAPEPRIVSVTSDGHRLSAIRWADYNFDEGRTYNRWLAYGQSKTANILFAVSLAEKLGKRGLRAYSVHPGVIYGTGLGSHLDMSPTGDFAELAALERSQGNQAGWQPFDLISAQQGAATHVYASFDPDVKKHNGVYLLECRVSDPWTDAVKCWSVNEIEAELLWRLSEKLVGQEFSYKQ